jgi:hypothetical protein
MRRLAKQKQGLYAQWLQSGGNSLAGPYASASYQDDLAWCEAGVAPPAAAWSAACVAGLTSHMQTGGFGTRISISSPLTL